MNRRVPALTMIPFLAAILAVLCLVPGCAGKDQQQVVVYTALDEMYSRPILDEFEKRTGIIVVSAYDTEASKTTGLVNRLIAEKDRPRADVFWNNEVAHTIVLKGKGLLAQYESPAAAAIPEAFKDPEGYWTGFAARGRVIIYNTNLIKEPPSSINDLLDPQWAGRAAIGKPLFGTTATHAAALFAAWGNDRAQAFFNGLRENMIAILAGNATVRDMVASGQYAWGLTDTDDANGAIEDGLPAQWIFPDQGEGELGTLVIPNTVALVKGGPNPESGKALIDFLLSPDVEARLAGMRSIQIPLNPAVDTPPEVPRLDTIRAMSVTFDAIAGNMETSSEFIKTKFLR